jgi:DNA-binding HxlR family transcriptional regulator
LEIVGYTKVTSMNMETKEHICERTISIIGNKWILMIVNEFNTQKEPIRFNSLLKTLSPISSKTLSVKLKDLVKYTILEKKIISMDPIITTYELTEKGKDLAGLFNSMTKWGKKWQKQ